jgi:hypothetical protein
MAYNSKYTGAQVDAKLDDIDKKQDTLVSGENIKTINGESILGKGNLDIVVAEVGIETCDIRLTLDGEESSELVSAEIVVLDSDSGKEYVVKYVEGGVLVPIDAGHRYSITCKRIGNYLPPVIFEAIAIKDYTRTVTLNYTSPPIGVYYYTIEGKVVGINTFSGVADDVFGIYVSNGENIVLLHKELPMSNGSYAAFSGYKLTNTQAGNSGMNFYKKADDAVVSDFDGKRNTEILSGIYQNSIYAHTAVTTKIFPDGVAGYLPAAGQLKMICDNLGSIRPAYTKIGLVGFEGALGLSGANFISSSYCQASSTSNAGPVYQNADGVFTYTTSSVTGVSIPCHDF